MGIQINGNNDIISALDGSWTAEGASINTSGILTATTFKGNIVGTAATFTGPVTIGGTLTYEDVTNIDSVGIITARDGIEITGGTLKLPTSTNAQNNANLNILYQGDGTGGTTAGVIDSDAGLKYNPAQDTLKVNGSLLSANSLYGATGTLKLAAANHSSTSYVSVTNFVSISMSADKVVRFSGGIGEIGNVTGFQATNEANNALTSFGMRATDLRFATGNYERLRIDSSGRVVISNNSGSHAGGSQFVVMGGAINTYASAAFGNYTAAPTGGTTFAMFRFNSGSTGTSRGAEIIAAADANWTAGSNYPTRLIFSTTGNSTNNATSATERLRIDSAGKTTSYGQIALSAGGAERFNISHTSGGNITVKNPTAANITFQIQNHSDQLQLHNNGRVGMGIGSPDGKLHVHSATAGTVTADADADELTLESSGNTGMSILSPGTGESSIYFGNPGTNGQKDGWIKYYHETHSTTANRRNLVFATGGNTERLRIGNDGTLTLKNNSNMMIDLQSSAGTGSAWIEFSDTDGTRKGYFGYGSSGSEKVYWVQSKAANMSMYSNGNDRFEVQSDGQKIVKNGRLNINSTFIDFSGSISTPATAAAIYRPADNTLAVSTANTEKLKIDGSGVLYHKPSGNSTNAYLKAENSSSTYILKSQKDGTADTNISFRVQDGGSLAALLYLRGDNKTVAIGPNITPARNLHVQEQFLVANIGTNGGQPYVSSTPILAVGTDGSNVVPGDGTYRHNALVSFGVGGHNAGDPASNSYSGACPALPYFKLDLYGQTGVGDVGTNLDSTFSMRSINPNNTRLRIRTKDDYNGTYPDADISFTQQQGTELARIRCDTVTSAANQASLSFWTNYGGLYERVHIDQQGDILMYRFTSLFGHEGFRYFNNLSGGPQIQISRSGGQCLLLNRNTSDGAIMEFRRGWGAGGSVEVGTNSCTYNTSSDYRLKENVVSISDGITRLKTLKPSRFNWIGDTNSTRDGFLAHEVTAVPEAISGTKDETYTEDNDELNVKSGDPKYQGIDQSKLVPLLTAALQEAIAKIETLETKVAALESS